MKANLLFLFLFFMSATWAQNYFQTTDLGTKTLFDNRTDLRDVRRAYSVDLQGLMAHLRNAPQRQNFVIPQSLTVSFPSVNGEIETFYVAEASNFAPGLQDRYQDIRSYRGIKVGDNAVHISIAISPNGVQTMRREVGGKMTFIEPITQDRSVYAVFEKTQKGKNDEFECTTEDHLSGEMTTQAYSSVEPLHADDQKLRSFRLAVSVTGEYTQWHGGTVAAALAAINATLARVNPIYENETALTMVLIENNDDVIYTNAATDPYSPASGMNQWNSQLQSTLTSVIGEANYDIGHLFGATGGGGNAGCIGCVCVNGQKGSGYTSPANGVPQGDLFDIDYVAHELGHQFGANHTFSRREFTGANMEPGTGSTIMAYAGLGGGGVDMQMNSHDYFHFFSIQQITNNIKNKNCPTVTDIANQPPVAVGGSDYNIPVGTPFWLEGSASDPDGDPMTYVWEQANSSTANTFVTADPNSTTNPLFRSIEPSTDTRRYFPSFHRVLANDLYSSFEALPDVARTLFFNFEVRDNSPSGVGQTKGSRINVFVRNVDGPFRITSITPGFGTSPGSTHTLTWNVAGTNAAPFNVSNVQILMSTDGGQNFNVVHESVPNNGSAEIAIPAGMITMNAHVMIVPIEDAIFYTVSPAFMIGYELVCTEHEATSLPIAIPDGQGPNQYGAWVEADINVEGEGTTDLIEVEVDITHTYVGDLQIALKSPAYATSLLLWNRFCNSGRSQGIEATFTDNGSTVTCSSPVTGQINPANPLSTFSNIPKAGLWQVRVRDGYNQDTGTINAAKIRFCSLEENISTDDLSATATEFAVYPNPSRGEFNLKADLKEVGLDITVYDVTGKLIKTQKDANASGAYSTTIDLQQMPTGTYILVIKNGKEVQSKKLLKR
ncbi:MAG: zinc-dependent metalloprotease family protein [Weeksellaceae bacterium]|nr:zinc-dependent metalloprotease family protein [Weeksellaceae bacterium]